MARGRRGRLLESKSRRLAAECDLEWSPLQKFRKAHKDEINTVLASGFNDKPSASVKSSRDSLKAEAAKAGIDWANFQKFIEGLMPLIQSFMMMCA